MPVPVSNRVNAHVPNGVTTTFAYQFKILDEDEILVEIDGVTQVGNYTVSGVGEDNGGNVVFSPAPTGTELVLSSNTPYDRETDYQRNGSFLESTVDRDYDRILIQIQQLWAGLKRAIKLPKTVTVDQVLPDAATAAERASTVVGFDADGDAILFPAQAGTSLADLAASTGARLLGFIQSGTGLSATTVETQLRKAEFFESIAALKAWSGPTNKTVAFVRGYYAAGDGGGGLYYYDSASSATDNGGTIIRPTAAPASGRWLRQYDAAQYSVKVFGAKGDNATDDTTFIQACINAITTAKATGGRMLWQAGRYIITATLTFPAGSGGGFIEGAGEYVGDPRTGSRVGPHTILVWDGTVGGTMVDQEGGLGWKWSGVTFVGRPDSGDANRAGIGFLCSYNSSFGSGVGMFEGVSAVDFPVAVQMAESSGDGGCADMLMGRIAFETCDTGFLVKNTQGLNYVFTLLSANSVKRVIHCENGGSVTINAANFAACGGTGADEWMLKFDTFNDGGGIATVNGLRIEQNSKQLLKVANLGSVTFNGFQEAQSDQNVTMVNTLGARITFNDSRLVTNDATEPHFRIEYGAGNQRPSLILNNTHFDAATFVFGDWFELDSADESFLQVKNCSYKDNQEHLPDINSHLLHGPVTHFCQTTNANATVSSLNGVTTSSISNICRIPPNSLVRVLVHVVGKEVGGGVDIGAFTRLATFSNKSNVVAIEGAMETIGTDLNTDTWGGVDVVAVDSLDGIRTNVTGKASTTINWRVTYYPAAVVELS